MTFPLPAFATNTVPLLYSPATLTTMALNVAVLGTLVGCVDARGKTRVRVIPQIITVPGFGTSVGSFHYSPDAGVTWYWASGTAYVAGVIGSEGPQASLAAVGTIPSSYVTLAAAARIKSLLIRPVVAGGDGILSPIVTAFLIEFAP